MCPNQAHRSGNDGTGPATAASPPTTTLAERRHPERRIVSLEATAGYFRVSTATPRYWVRRGYVTGFVDSKQALFLDLDEIEAALRSNPRMRDGRRSRYGSDARIEPLPARPVRAEVVQPESGES